MARLDDLRICIQNCGYLASALNLMRFGIGALVQHKTIRKFNLFNQQIHQACGPVFSPSVFRPDL